MALNRISSKAAGRNGPCNIFHIPMIHPIDIPLICPTSPWYVPYPYPHPCDMSHIPMIYPIHIPIICPISPWNVPHPYRCPISLSISLTTAHTSATKWRCIESAAKLGAGMATAATATARPFSTMRTSSLPEHIHAKCVGCEHVHTILCSRT